MRRHKFSIPMVYKMFVCALGTLGTAIAGKKESDAMVLSLDINSAGVLILGLCFCMLRPPVWRLWKRWQIHGS